MRSRSGFIRALFVGLVVVGVCAPLTLAQMRGNQTLAPANASTDQQQTELHSLTDVQTQGQGIDKREFADYKVFYKENQEPAKKIQLGQAFLQKYPKSALTEAVDAQLVNAYVARQDWSNVYLTADRALALEPNDVDVLTTVGWIIPHVYHPDDPDADALLHKAETYERHAMEVLTTMPKPPSLTDSQFATLKAGKNIQAHIALGLIYFRRGDYDNSAKELRQAVQNNSAPDPADLYVLGVDLENLNRAGEAADVFGSCAAIGGSLQSRCRESADATRKTASH